jgi:predicted outer membrane repeat protein
MRTACLLVLLVGCDGPAVQQDEPDLLQGQPDLLQPDLLQPDLLQPDLPQPDLLQPDLMPPLCTNVNCGSNGTCAPATGLCVCSEGWVGAACNQCARYVDLAATGSGDAKSWSNAATRVQPALDSAAAAVTAGAASCEVWVAKGTYYTYGSARTDQITLKSNVQLYGGFAGTETLRSQRDSVANVTVLSGKNAGGTTDVYHILRAATVTNVIVDGFEVTGGHPDQANPNDRGPGLFSTSSSIKLDHMSFHDNIAGAEGGAIASQNDPLFEVDHSSFTANQAGQRGGAIYVTGSTTVHVDNTTFTSNVSVLGGGAILVFNADTRVRTSTFVANRTGSQGGGIYQAGKTLTVESSRFERNQGGDGGAIGMFTMGGACRVAGSTLLGNRGGNGGGIHISSNAGTQIFTLENLVIAGNESGAPGGAIARTGGSDTIVVRNATIYGNHAPSANAFYQPAAGSFTVSNTIVWGNHVLGGTDWNAAAAPTFDTCVVDDNTLGGTNLSGDPLLAAAPLFYQRVASGSTATDVVVASATGFQVGHTVEIDHQHLRTIMSMSGNTLTLSAALPSAPPANTLVTNWGTAPAATDESFLPGAASSALDAANGNAAPATDYAGNARVDLAGVANTGTGTPAFADIGAYERQ